MPLVKDIVKAEQEVLALTTMETRVREQMGQEALQQLPTAMVVAAVANGMVRLVVAVAVAAMVLLELKEAKAEPARLPEQVEKWREVLTQVLLFLADKVVEEQLAKPPAGDQVAMAVA